MRYAATWPMGAGNLIELDEGFVLHAGDLNQAKYLAPDGSEADAELASRMKEYWTDRTR